jgi:hypothetical protein
MLLILAFDLWPKFLIVDAVSSNLPNYLTFFLFSILRKVTIRKFNFRVLTTGRIKNVFEISFVGFTHGINCPGN